MVRLLEELATARTRGGGWHAYDLRPVPMWLRRPWLAISAARLRTQLIRWRQVAHNLRLVAQSEIVEAAKMRYLIAHLAYLFPAADDDDDRSHEMWARILRRTYFCCRYGDPCDEYLHVVWYRLLNRPHVALSNLKFRETTTIRISADGPAIRWSRYSHGYLQIAESARCNCAQFLDLPVLGNLGRYSRSYSKVTPLADPGIDTWDTLRHEVSDWADTLQPVSHWAHQKPI